MRICVFGGSATWGEADNVNGGWVNLLRNELSLLHIYTYNLGISGDTTREIVKRVRNECEYRKPDLIIFSVGLNDSTVILPGNKHLVPVKDFKVNLHKLLGVARDLSSKVVFIGPPRVVEEKTTPIPWNTSKSYTNASISTYVPVLRQFSEENAVPFIDLFDLLELGDFAEDGLHPNTQGHKKIFDRVEGVIRGLI